MVSLVQLFLRLNFRDPGVWLAIATPLVAIWLGAKLLRFLALSPRVQQALQHPAVRLSLRPFAWARAMWLTLAAVTELPPAASSTVADPAEPSTPMARRAHFEAPIAASAYAAYPATPAQTPGANRRLDWLEQPVATPSSAVAMGSYPATQVFTQLDLLARKLWQGGHAPAPFGAEDDRSADAQERRIEAHWTAAIGKGRRLSEITPNPGAAEVPVPTVLALLNTLEGMREAIMAYVLTQVKPVTLGNMQFLLRSLLRRHAGPK